MDNGVQARNLSSFQRRPFPGHGFFVDFWTLEADGGLLESRYGGTLYGS